MKKILTYGTYDLFHIGHLRLLERAKALGDHLTVAISTDEFNLLKGKTCIVSYADRAAIIEALKCVDKVIPEVEWDQKVRDVIENDIDIFIMGHDWEGKFDKELANYCEVKYLKRTVGISTTQLKEQLKD